MIYEIRNYHFEPTLMVEYKAWAGQRALPYLRTELDLVGFWTSLDEPAHARMAEVFATPEWTEIAAGNPGLEHYHRIEAKFAEEL